MIRKLIFASAAVALVASAACSKKEETVVETPVVEPAPAPAPPAADASTMAPAAPADGAAMAPAAPAEAPK